MKLKERSINYILTYITLKKEIDFENKNHPFENLLKFHSGADN